MSTVPVVSNPLTPEEVVQQLRALRDQISGFVLLTQEDVQQLAPAATVEIAFLHAAINAIAASQALRDALGRDAEELRQSVELAGRWSQVADELEALRLGITGAIMVRRHRVGAKALQAYQVSRQLARYKENANLLPHIDAMARAAKFTRRRTAQPQSKPAPAPTPAPMPTPAPQPEPGPSKPK